MPLILFSSPFVSFVAHHFGRVTECPILFLFSASPPSPPPSLALPASLPPSLLHPPFLEWGVMRMELNWSPPSGKQQEKIVHSERQEGVPPGLPYGRMTSLACCPIPTVHNRVTVAFSTVAQQPREEERQREQDREGEIERKRRKGKGCQQC